LRNYWGIINNIKFLSIYLKAN